MPPLPPLLPPPESDNHKATSRTVSSFQELWPPVDPTAGQTVILKMMVPIQTQWITTITWSSQKLESAWSTPWPMVDSMLSCQLTPFLMSPWTFTRCKMVSANLTQQTLESQWIREPSKVMITAPWCSLLKCQFVKDAQTTKEELKFTPTAT